MEACADVIRSADCKSILDMDGSLGWVGAWPSAHFYGARVMCEFRTCTSCEALEILLERCLALADLPAMLFIELSRRKKACTG